MFVLLTRARWSYYSIWSQRNICVANDFSYTLLGPYRIHDLSPSFFVNGAILRMTLVAHELVTLPEHTSSRPVFCVVVYRSLFVILSFLFFPLCCLSFDWRFVITHFVLPNIFLVLFYVNQYLQETFKRMFGFKSLHTEY